MMAARGRGQFAPERANWTERARYRTGQFFDGWRASVTTPDWSLVEQALFPAGRAAVILFSRMRVDAQAHSLRVLKSLQAEGPTPHDLAAATLLHDVGKAAADEAGAYLGLWLRGPLVVLEAWRPHLLARMASPQPSAGLRYAIYVQHAHPQIGAAWARQAGCSQLTCWLIAHHQDESAAGLGGASDQATATLAAASADAAFDQTTARSYLARLQWADGRN